MTDFFRYQVANASQERLDRAHYVIDLKEERLISSHEAFSYLKDLRKAQELRDSIREGYQRKGMGFGWEPKLAAIPHLENLTRHLSHVLGVIAMNEHIPTPHHNLYQSSVVTKGTAIEISITVPSHEEISASSLAYDSSSSEMMSVRMFASERTDPWRLTLTSAAPVVSLLGAGCRGVTRLRQFEREDIEELTHQLGALSEHASRTCNLSLGEQMVFLGMLSGLSEVSFEARISIGETVSSPFQLPRVSVFEDGRIDRALRNIPSSLSREIIRDVRAAALKQSPGFSFPVTVPWGVVFERAQSTENTGISNNGEIRSERLRRAVGLAFIESLSPEYLSDSSRVVNALTYIDDWLDAARSWPKDNPQVLRYRTLREIIRKNNDYFESLFPPLRATL